MRLVQFQILMELKKHGSFCKAAQAMYLSQPALSTAIKNLEVELGYLIVKRSNDGIEFTEQGDLVMEKVFIIMQDIASIRSIKDDFKYYVKGEIKLGADSRACSSILADTVINMKKKYPLLSVNLDITDRILLIDRVAAGDLQIGLLQINSKDKVSFLSELQRRNLFFHKLFFEDNVFFVRSNHPLLTRKKVNLRDVLQFPYVTAKSYVDEYLLKIIHENHNTHNINYIKDITAINIFLENTDSITTISRREAIERQNFFRDKLVPLEVSDFEWKCEVGCIRSGVAMSKVEEVTIKELISICERYNFGTINSKMA
ncbi:MAG: LysR family transcriptional regulator [Peptococcaceae bacterium]